MSGMVQDLTRARRTAVFVRVLGKALQWAESYRDADGYRGMQTVTAHVPGAIHGPYDLPRARWVLRQARANLAAELARLKVRSSRG